MLIECDVTWLQHLPPTAQQHSAAKAWTLVSVFDYFPINSPLPEVALLSPPYPALSSSQQTSRTHQFKTTQSEAEGKDAQQLNSGCSDISPPNPVSQTHRNLVVGKRKAPVCLCRQFDSSWYPADDFWCKHTELICRSASNFPKSDWNLKQPSWLTCCIPLGNTRHSAETHRPLTFPSGNGKKWSEAIYGLIFSGCKYK